MPSSSHVKGVVAILGGTGDIGSRISRIFLTEYREQFPVVRVTTRDLSSSKAQELAKLGAELFKTSESFDDVLFGVDVVINAFNAKVIEQVGKQLNAAIARANPKVYFLGGFGVDHRFNEFDGYEHPVWHTKRVIAADANAALKGTQTKVIQLATGMFLGWLLIPDLGIDIEKNVYTPLGPASNRIATTGEDDIGRSIAQLAILSLDPETASTVPTTVRIAGQNSVSRVKGVLKGEIESKSQFKNVLKQNPSDNVLQHIWVLIGQGKVDFSNENANELVNPGESLWNWKTVEDHLRGAV